MYKIVFFDVDGTLVSEIDRSIPLSTLEAIEKLLERGIKVVVATGDRITYVKSSSLWALIPLFLLTVRLSNVRITLSINQRFQQKPCGNSRLC